ncbi:hypothetical protein D6T65_05130 [Arthrobacter frigidicola]|nr:hypothetical protein D6T65_05130 [Arthrobacter frigidicola]
MICGGGKWEVLVDKVDGEPRWCFNCRKVRDFRFIVSGDSEPSYYEPNPSIRCAVCKTDDGDCFPGRFRVWGEQ